MNEKIAFSLDRTITILPEQGVYLTKEAWGYKIHPLFSNSIESLRILEEKVWGECEWESIKLAPDNLTQEWAEVMFGEEVDR